MTSQFFVLFHDQKEDSPSGIPLERTAVGRMMDNELNETGEQVVRGFPCEPNKIQTTQSSLHNQKYALSGSNDTLAHRLYTRSRRMISHQTLYNLANYLGALAMITVVAYHFVAVNVRHIAGNQQSH